MKPSFFGRNHLIILVILAFLAPLMLAGTRRALMSNKNNVKEWLPAGYEETTTFDWYRSIFPSDMFVLASWEGCTLDSAALELMARKLVEPDDPNWSPTNARPRFFRQALTGKHLVAQLVEKQGLTEEQAVERLRGILIGQDGQQSCLILSVDQQSEQVWESHREAATLTLIDRALGRKTEAYLAAEALGVDPNKKFLHALVERVYEVAEKECGISRDNLHLGGPPVDNISIDQEGERSLLRLAGVSALVGFFMSWWCLRSWALTAIVFTSALFTAGLSLAAVALTGATMNAIMLSMPSLVYVTATSGAIHLANYYRDAVRQHGIEGAADRAARNGWLPLALATGTTAIGLASMCITDLVPIRMFGIYSAIGVVLSFFVVMFYMPSMLHLIPLHNIAKPRESVLYDPGLSPRWRHVGYFILRHNVLVTAACLVVMAVGTWGVLQTETSVKLMRLFSPNARIIQDYAWLEEKLGPLVPMEVVIRVDRKTCQLDTLERMTFVSNVQKAIMQLPEVGSTMAAPTFAPNMPRRPSMLERRSWIVQLDKHRDELRDYLYVTEDEELWRVSARIAALNDLDYGEFVADIRAAVTPVLESYQAEGVEGVSAIYTGLVPLIYKAQSSMLNGLALNFVGDLLLIGIATMFLLRNVSAGFLLALPCLFPLAIVFGYLGWAGIVVDVGTVMVPAVALGVTVDDGIHFMIWCRHGEERGMSKTDSIMFAYADCARAIYQSWGVIGLGLAAFALSTFQPTQRFGYMMLAMLTVSMIGNLVMLPALMAGPLGSRFWGQVKRKATAPDATDDGLSAEPDVEPATAPLAVEEIEADESEFTIPMPVHVRHDAASPVPAAHRGHRKPAKKRGA
jgi:hypothetical protein